MSALKGYVIAARRGLVVELHEVYSPSYDLAEAFVRTHTDWELVASAHVVAEDWERTRASVLHAAIMLCSGEFN